MAVKKEHNNLRERGLIDPCSWSVISRDELAKRFRSVRKHGFVAVKKDGSIAVDIDIENAVYKAKKRHSKPIKDLESQ